MNKSSFPVGQILPGGQTAFAVVRESPVFSFPVNTGWCSSVDLLSYKPGAKTRQARVWIETHGQSVFQRLFILVRVDTCLSDQEASTLAANKAHARGKGHSWVLWARGEIAAKYGSLIGDPAFTAALRNLTAEWIPKTSPEGRAHLTKTLGLGSFEALAFKNLKK